jgi:MFS family permease
VFPAFISASRPAELPHLDSRRRARAFGLWVAGGAAALVVAALAGGWLSHPAAPPEPATPPAIAASPPGGLPHTAPPEPAELEEADAGPEAVARYGVRSAVSAWATAWSDRSADQYLACYSARFRPPGGQSRAAWERQRRDRLAAPRFIEVAVSALQIDLIGPNRATAAFRQSYRSDTYSDEVDKALSLAFEDGLWRIVEENAGS